MKLKSKYQAKQADSNGFIDYSIEEDEVWRSLYARQIQIVQTHACLEFIEGLAKLNMPADRVPQLADINRGLLPLTGWSVVAVPALISTDHFFTLLNQRQFPAATFIRLPEELDYLQEPDIFHEFFGHCPLLTNPVYADFMQKYGEVALAAPEADRELLARLFWFTVEFGLIKTPQGIRCYGGGILSSKNETIYALESKLPDRKAFKLMDVLRTPYRIDIMQPIYYVIDSYDQLYELLNADLSTVIQQAKNLGEFAPSFKTSDYTDQNDEWVTC